MGGVMDLAAARAFDAPRMDWDGCWAHPHPTACACRQSCDRPEISDLGLCGTHYAEIVGRSRPA